ncbi:RD3 domain-containing protein [Engraulis encrasicolus]|uniref:RD3 domain-containing protein n=1 Tax=Engraulis encrasicolus TaxID=184585 RepID=UPI002FD0D01E
MFPWSAVLNFDSKVPGQRTSEELVTNTLMLELGAMVKRTERIQLERAQMRRRRSSNSSVDYSWLATQASKVPFELTSKDVLELQDLCAKIPPSVCGPAIVRFRKLITQMEPDVAEVPRLFRTVLQNTLEEMESDAELQERVSRWDKQQRAKSLSFVNFRSRFRSARGSVGGFISGSRGNLQEQGWLDEEEGGGGEEEEEDDEVLTDKMAAQRGARRARSRSMPNIIPMESREQS